MIDGARTRESRRSGAGPSALGFLLGGRARGWPSMMSTRDRSSVRPMPTRRVEALGSVVDRPGTTNSRDGDAARPQSNRLFASAPAKPRIWAMQSRTRPASVRVKRGRPRAGSDFLALDRDRTLVTSAPQRWRMPERGEKAGDHLLVSRFARRWGLRQPSTSPRATVKLNLRRRRGPNAGEVPDLDHLTQRSHPSPNAVARDDGDIAGINGA